MVVVASHAVGIVVVHVPIQVLIQRVQPVVAHSSRNKWCCTSQPFRGDGATVLEPSLPIDENVCVVDQRIAHDGGYLRRCWQWKGGKRRDVDQDEKEMSYM